METKQRPILLWLASLVAVAVCIAVILVATRATKRPPRATEPPPAGVASDAKAHTTYSVRPLTRQEGEQALGWDFPPGAHDVQFAARRQGLSATVFVRFEAPANECRAFAEGMLARRWSGAAPTTVPTTAPTSDDASDLGRLRPAAPAAGRLADPTILSIPWFDPAQIQTGLEGGPADHPLLWVDSARGIFYYQESGG